MSTVEVTRTRSDKLARQTYGFYYDPVHHVLVLDQYLYQERLTTRKRWTTCQQWLRSAADFFHGRIELKDIPIDPAIIEAAKHQFSLKLGVVKEVPTDE